MPPPMHTPPHLLFFLLTTTPLKIWFHHTFSDSWFLLKIMIFSFSSLSALYHSSWHGFIHGSLTPTFSCPKMRFLASLTIPRETFLLLHLTKPVSALHSISPPHLFTILPRPNWQHYPSLTYLLPSITLFTSIATLTSTPPQKLHWHS